MDWKNWVTCGILASLLCSVIFTSQYRTFEERMDQNYGVRSSSEEELAQEGTKWLYLNNYILYRDLYNRVNSAHASYSELYLAGVQEALSSLQGYVDEEDEEQEEVEEYYYQYYREYENLANSVERFQRKFDMLDQDFPYLNRYFDYLIEDSETGIVISNTQGIEPDVLDSGLYISFIYDGAGNVELGDMVVCGNVTEAELCKFAGEAARILNMQDLFRLCLYESSSEWANTNYDSEISSPRNCRVIYRIDLETWQVVMGELEGAHVSWSNDTLTLNVISKGNTHSYYYLSDAGGFHLIMFLFAAVLLAGLFLPGIDSRRPWLAQKIFRLPFELLLALGFGCFALQAVMLQMAVSVIDQSLLTDSLQFLSSLHASKRSFLQYLANYAALTLYFFLVWYLGVSLRCIRDMKFREYFKERCLSIRVFKSVRRGFGWLCKRVEHFYLSLSHFDLTKRANKYIVKVVLINAAILFIICIMWVGGWPVTVIYSLALYVILRKYVSDLQRQYSVLLNALYQIAEGHLNVSVTEDMGVFNPLKPHISRIQEGFKKAVEEETKSQRMKAELITNVSHDLKTPLTAIITYIGLLKEQNLTEEQRADYLDTLERKAIRLKALIEDLFEVSKANSQNMTLNLVEVDLGNLVKQAAFELEDKLKTADLDLRMMLPKEKISLQLDSQKTYRIFENLFGNVAKYALHGTRVYVECRKEEEYAEVVIKNIAAEEIVVSGQELTERFVRGDASRGKTEGNGLGLAIAKSFAQLQGGSLDVDVDGDLFKVTVRLNLYLNN